MRSHLKGVIHFVIKLELIGIEQFILIVFHDYYLLLLHYSLAVGSIQVSRQFFTGTLESLDSKPHHNDNRVTSDMSKKGRNKKGDLL